MKQSRIGYVDFSGGPLNFVVRGTRPGDCEASPGCAHCYALAGLLRFGVGQEQTTVFEERLGRLATVRLAPPPGGSFRRGPGSRPFAFVCDTGDLFHPSVDYGVLLQFMRVVERRADIDFLVLTKRAYPMLKFIRWFCAKYERPPLGNLWLGVSVENQRAADDRVFVLQDTPAAHRWLSVEPMLGPVDLRPFLDYQDAPRIDWVICGAESGPERRPFEKVWAEDLHAQCRRFGVSFFGKQASGLYPGQPLLLGQPPEVVLEFPASGHA